VTPTLGPDATGVGWVYQYAVMAKDMTLAELRSLQDWKMRFGLACRGRGRGRQRRRLRQAIRDRRRSGAAARPRHLAGCAARGGPRSNLDVGGRTVELSEFEFMVRGRGYLKSIADIENIVLKSDRGVPLRLSDVARVELGPDERRGITELNGEGEVASGIVLQRFGANALAVIEHAKARLAEIAPSLPEGPRSCRSMTAPG
jgi:Cu(I)/Ag(I) efflux system membrane protein CusA/SilA